MRLSEIGIELLIGAAVLTHAMNAHAYLDPVTGSMLIQGLIGAIAAAAVAIKLYWGRLKTWFARVTGKQVDTGDAEEEETTPGSTAVEKE